MLNLQQRKEIRVLSSFITDFNAETLQTSADHSMTPTMS